jgi:protein O-GlcNAc transferase
MSEDLELTFKRAATLHGQGQPAQAAALYAEILRSQPDHSDTLHLLGVTETQLGRPQEGLEWIAKSLTLNPNQPAAIANQGNALLMLQRPTEALASYDQALALWPEYPLAVYGRGNALSALGRPHEALSDFDRALDLAPNFLQALVGRAGVLRKLGRHADSLAEYDRAIELSPEHVSAHVGRAAALLGLKDYTAARFSIDRALQLAPHSAEALTERGHLLSELDQIGPAIETYDQALRSNAAHATAWFSRGLLLSTQGHFVEATASLRKVLDIDPQYAYAPGGCLHAQLQVCDWNGYAGAEEHIATSMERDEPVDFPFSFLAVCDSPRLQRRCARVFADLQLSDPPALRSTARSARERIRVAYISSDFLEHPTSYLMAGVFEKHDRQQFDIVGISLREDETSPTGKRVRGAFDEYIEAGSRSDQELAQLIQDMGVDIAVDLMGYTGEHRAGIFNFRPAPLQVNYLGFPGTMGTADRDYIIADDFLIPEAQRAHYSEAIAYLPECFQANDDRKPTADAPSRELMGLPATGLVWCSLHSSYKLNPPMFDIWAKLVLGTPDSVLWLLGGNPTVEENLRRQALARGVPPQRLVFAQPLPYAEHLARLSLADICLDTLPFNGGATSSDALWAGVPLITCAGRSFAARMSGSLLHAVGIPELITHSLSEYEQLALLLARDPMRLAQIRTKLALNRLSAPLFNTDRFRRHLEALYTAMVERHRQGLRPTTFRTPELPP